MSGRRDQSLNVSLCVSVTPSHALDETVVGHRDAVADEARRELRVENARRAHAVARREEQQVARGRVHHELHGRVADQLGDRADVDVLERIQHGDALRCRQLQQAWHRAVGALPDELGVERKATLAAGRRSRSAWTSAGSLQMLDRQLTAGLLPDAREGTGQAWTLSNVSSVFSRRGKHHLG